MAHRGISWAAEVLRRLKGTDFPVTKDVLKEKLKGLYWKGIPIEKLLEEIEVNEFQTPAEVLHYLAEAARKLEASGQVSGTGRVGISWAAEVLRRLKGTDFPVTKDVLKEKLKGVYWKGIPVEVLLDHIEKDEFETPAELLHYLAEAARKLEDMGFVAESAQQ
jgi:predicted transcriptional regulator